MFRPMSCIAAAICVLAVAGRAERAPVPPERLTVPSGQVVEYFETVMDGPAMGLTARFRFLAPELPAYLDRLTYQELEADMAALCDVFALPRLGAPRPSLIVISLTSEATEFGDTNPDVAQVFEAYRPAETHCVWEAF